MMFDTVEGWTAELALRKAQGHNLIQESDSESGIQQLGFTDQTTGENCFIALRTSDDPYRRSPNEIETLLNHWASLSELDSQLKDLDDTFIPFWDEKDEDIFNVSSVYKAIQELLRNQHLINQKVQFEGTLDASPLADAFALVEQHDLRVQLVLIHPVMLDRLERGSGMIDQKFEDAETGCIGSLWGAHMFVSDLIPLGVYVLSSNIFGRYALSSMDIAVLSVPLLEWL